MSVIPPPQEWTRATINLPSKLLERLEELQAEVNAERPKSDRFSRDRFIQIGLEWFERELTEERRRAKK